MSQSNTALLRTLATDWGYSDPLDMIEDYIFDGLMPAICKTSCGYSTEMEPDQTAGWCECCNANTVVSAQVLAGLI